MKCKRSTKGTISSRDAFGYTRGQKTAVRLSEFKESDSQTNDEVAPTRLLFPSFFPLLNTCTFQKGLLLSCLRVILPQPEKSNRSRASFMPLIVVVNLKRRSCRL
ncbi:hypothetical protein AVEN_151253-1 [Araneus ventricosus]|uniref:Uncharacterized protein n=1 Tax=Araneus ventricosus TaxID=182803 RepID=A0A4Y2V172_ARAVE|nr:hypothetical protein AVEN_151253-1 [Araneus ventricosus]